MNETKILWLSRYALTVDQMNDLKRIYGEVNIKHVSKQVSNWKEVVELGEDCSVLAVALPQNLLAELIKPKNNTKPVIRSNASWVETGRKIINPATGMEEDEKAFSHLGWQKIIKLELVVEEL